MGQLHRTNNLEISLFARSYFRLEVITISVFMVSYYTKTNVIIAYYAAQMILLISMSYTIKYLKKTQTLVDEFTNGFFFN